MPEPEEWILLVIAWHLHLLFLFYLYGDTPMIRSICMYFGMSPAWVREWRVTQDCENPDKYYLHYRVSRRRWATDEDVQVVRTKFLIMVRKGMRELLGGDMKFNPGNK